PSRGQIRRSGENICLPSRGQVRRAGENICLPSLVRSGEQVRISISQAWSDQESR
ncbi:unnamed protein product, partial [Staurois parvus]